MKLLVIFFIRNYRWYGYKSHISSITLEVSPFHRICGQSSAWVSVDIHEVVWKVMSWWWSKFRDVINDDSIGCIGFFVCKKWLPHLESICATRQPAAWKKGFQGWQMAMKAIPSRATSQHFPECLALRWKGVECGSCSLSYRWETSRTLGLMAYQAQQRRSFVSKSTLFPMKFNWWDSQGIMTHGLRFFWGLQELVLGFKQHVLVWFKSGRGVVILRCDDDMDMYNINSMEKTYLTYTNRQTGSNRSSSLKGWFNSLWKHPLISPRRGPACRSSVAGELVPHL